MKVIRSNLEMQDQANSWREEGLTIGLVPTMGFFHEGHLSLMRCARECSDRVVVSLFVNPRQFGPNEDLDKYPRAFDADSALASEQGVDVLFCPASHEVYDSSFQTNITVQKLSRGLCGADRPGHFDGVATVVTKLFNLVKPHSAVFGRKDYQQLALIRQLAHDLNYDIEIIGRPIVREADGLAMSSRNANLDDKGRAAATCLYRAIESARKNVRQNNGSLPAENIEKMVHNIIEAEPLCTIEYAKVVHRQSLLPVKTADKDSILALAMKVNNTVRLIDNCQLTG